MYRALGATGLVLGCALPASSADLSTQHAVPVLAAPGPACSVVPGALFGPLAARPPRKARRPQAQRHLSRQPEAKPRPPLQPGFSHAYYTCSSTPQVALRVGAGWLAVGPIRRS